jgi:hypothetical protein
MANGSAESFSWFMGGNNAWGPDHDTVTQPRMSIVESALKTVAGAVLLLPGSKPAPLKAGEAGAYSNLVARSVVGDWITPHHMPMAALEFTSRGEGGALALHQIEHVLTRSFAGRGAALLRAERGLGFRPVLARDIRDIRRLFGARYDVGLRQLLDYYRQRFPDLMKR